MEKKAENSKCFVNSLNFKKSGIRLKLPEMSADKNQVSHGRIQLKNGKCIK